MRRKRGRAVFLDRDGTLLRERGYLAVPGRMKFYPRVAESLARLKRRGFRLVVISNQSGVGRGYFSLAQLAKIHKRFRSRLGKVRIDGIYFCPHPPDAGCSCRKPRPGLVRRAARDLFIDPRRSYVVGDQARDVELAHRVGAKGVLVLTGAGRSARGAAASWKPKVTSSIATASRWIIKDLEHEKS